jgi:sugar fermentation stimulation protein A
MTSIRLPGPLIETRFVERPNRFVVRCSPAGVRARGIAHAAAHADAARAAAAGVDARGDDASAAGVIYDAHMADPGRLRELLVPGRRVWLRHAAGPPQRRTRWSAVLVETPDGTGLVSIDTTLPNRLVRAALEAGAVEELGDWTLERREVTLGESRIDFVLRHDDGRRMALEVKSVTLVEDGVALFPDAITARGARHVRELARIRGQAGWEAALLFVVQRPDAVRVHAAASIDPAFARALADAREAGVRVLGRRCNVTLEHLELAGPLPAG